MKISNKTKIYLKIKRTFNITKLNVRKIQKSSRFEFSKGKRSVSINPEIELTFTVIDAQKEFNEDDDEVCEGKK